MDSEKGVTAVGSRSHSLPVDAFIQCCAPRGSELKISVTPRGNYNAACKMLPESTWRCRAIQNSMLAQLSLSLGCNEVKSGTECLACVLLGQFRACAVADLSLQLHCLGQNFQNKAEQALQIRMSTLHRLHFSPNVLPDRPRTAARSITLLQSKHSHLHNCGCNK
jgi:hypothetical protein